MLYLRSVTTLELDSDRCTGCWRCLDVCPHAVFERNGSTVRIRDRDACMECGACERNCAFGAMSVRSGVGCASAIISGALRGSEPGCGGESCCG